MKHRENVLLQYSIATFFVTLVISLSLALLLAGNVTEYYLRSHVESFPAIVELAFQQDQETQTWFDHPEQGPPPDLRLRLEGLLKLGKIFRIKVWSPAGVILWSDQASLIGQSDPSDEFREALEERRPVYEVGEANAAENAEEKSHGVVLEIYTPLLHEGRVVGVIELYEDNQDLFQQITVNTRDVWGLVLAFGLLLYLVLFGVFYRSYRDQRRALSELDQTEQATIFALAYQAELRDHETGTHLERTARYVDLLCKTMGLPAEQRALLVRAAPLHDIGKVGIPDAILLKQGPLSTEERAVMQTHCVLGDSVLAAAEKKLPFRSFLATARELVMSHHEKWDGTGYPHRLAGESIPLSGRIMALADVYDALRSRRPYKSPRSHEECVADLKLLSGTHFDPSVVGAFLQVEGQFQKISENLE